MPDRTKNNIRACANHLPASYFSTPSKPALDQRETEILLGLALGKPREFILAHPEVKLNFWQKIRYRRLIKKRTAGVPLAYLAGRKEFFGLDFIVTRATLIPRPETEALVEAALAELTEICCATKQIAAEQTAAKIIGQTQPRPILLIDIGAGAGCIPISILRNLPPECTTRVTAYATDISGRALRVASRNAKLHGVKINLVRSNLLKNLHHRLAKLLPEFILITANLPYLTEPEYKNEPSLCREPMSALVGGGEDGLGLYLKLLTELPDWQKQNYRASPLKLILEMNPEQSEALQKTITTILPEAAVEVKLDLAGRTRALIVKIDQ